MKIINIKELLDAEIICGEEYLGKHVYSACGSDMMSEVLAYVKDQAASICVRLGKWASSAMSDSASWVMRRLSISLG